MKPVGNTRRRRSAQELAGETLADNGTIKALIKKPGPYPIAKRHDSARDVSARRKAPENERALLGMLLLGTPESEAAFKQLGALNSGHFSDPRHRIILDAVVTLRARTHLGCKYSVDLGSIVHELRQTRRLKAAGGKSYLASLKDGAPSAAQHVEAIMDAADPQGTGVNMLASIPARIPHITEGHKTSHAAGEENGVDMFDVLIMQMGMQFPTWTDAEIGAHFGMSREAINRRRNRPAFRAAISRAFQVGIEAAAEQLNLHASAVVQAMLVHALEKHGNESLQACKALLPYILPRQGKGDHARVSEPKRRSREISVSEKRSVRVEREVSYRAGQRGRTSGREHDA